MASISVRYIVNDVDEHRARFGPNSWVAQLRIVRVLVPTVGSGSCVSCA
jgi:hypothetical protein